MVLLTAPTFVNLPTMELLGLWGLPWQHPLLCPKHRRKIPRTFFPSLTYKGFLHQPISWLCLQGNFPYCQSRVCLNWFVIYFIRKQGHGDEMEASLPDIWMVNIVDGQIQNPIYNLANTNKLDLANLSTAFGIGLLFFFSSSDSSISTTNNPFEIQGPTQASHFQFQQWRAGSCCLSVGTR